MTLHFSGNDRLTGDGVGFGHMHTHIAFMLDESLRGDIALCIMGISSLSVRLDHRKPHLAQNILFGDYPVEEIIPIRIISDRPGESQIGQ